MRKKIIGIYKITSPTNRVYIGQSEDILRRFSSYKRLNCKSQPKLYNSLLKYSAESHKFEILIECGVSELNDLERYYQEMFNCIDPNVGLNCIMTETKIKKRIYNKDYSEKMSKIFKGRKFSDDTRKKMSMSKKGIKGLDHNTSVAVIAVNKLTEEKIVDSLTNVAKILNVNKEIISNRCKFHYVSPRKLIDWDFEYLDNPVKKELNLGQNKLVIDLETGVFYYGKVDLAISLNTTLSNLNHKKICENGRFLLC